MSDLNWGFGCSEKKAVCEMYGEGGIVHRPSKGQKQFTHEQLKMIIIRVNAHAALLKAVDTALKDKDVLESLGPDAEAFFRRARAEARGQRSDD